MTQIKITSQEHTENIESNVYKTCHMKFRTTNERHNDTQLLTRTQKEHRKQGGPWQNYSVLRHGMYIVTHTAYSSGVSQLFNNKYHTFYTIFHNLRNYKAFKLAIL